MKKLFKALAVSALIIGGVVGVLGWLGTYPVANVQGGSGSYFSSYIFAKDLTKEVAAFEHFKAAARTQDPQGFGFDKIKGDAQKAILEELIISAVVHEALPEFGRDVVRQELDQATREALIGQDDKKIDEAARGLYGVSGGEFKELFMKPQIEEIVLRKHVEATGAQYGTWLEERLKNTRVTVYFLPYQWREGKLEKNKRA